MRICGVRRSNACRVAADRRLTEGLKAEHDRAMPVTQVADRLFVLPAGRPDSDPMSGLTSERMKRLIAQAAATFDWVLIDTPPIGILPDANLLSAFDHDGGHLLR
jgi:Mrp family chromosome partitioning ATPase